MPDVSTQLEEISRFVVDTKWNDLPDSIICETKYLLLDSIGVALAAITTDPGKMVINLAKRLGGPPDSSIIGFSGKISCTGAAFANGELIRILDYNAFPPGGHDPENIIPPSLAIAEMNGASGKDLILAIALGFEIDARAASAAKGGRTTSWQFEGPKATFKSKTTGSKLRETNLGAAAGAGKIFNLDRSKMLQALGIASHLSQGSNGQPFTFCTHRPMHKYGSVGWQNSGAIMAVMLADMGYMGDTIVFDPEHNPGYEGWQFDRLTDDIGKKWTFTPLNYKPYPCCRQFHTTLDCFTNIIEKNNLRPEEIESVNVFAHPDLESPLFTNRELTNIIDVQFGLHYVLALSAYRVRVGAEWQDMDMVKDPKIVAFSKKVHFQAHPDFGQQFLKNPSSYLAKVEVVAKGQTFAEERLYSKGTPNTEFALTHEELVEKFKHNASRILTQNQIEGTLHTIKNLENVSRVSELMAQITN